MSNSHYLGRTLALCCVALAFAGCGGGSAPRAGVPRLRFIGQDEIASGTLFDGTEVGGLSGIDYHPVAGVYYAISDDRAQLHDARFYTLAIDLSDDALGSGDVTPLDVTTILDEADVLFAAGTVDPEAIRYDPDSQTLFWTSEGDHALSPPTVREMALDGTFLRELVVPSKFAPTADESSGIHSNFGFEGLARSADGARLLTANESALFQDGEAATVSGGSPVRLLELSRQTGTAIRELSYVTDPLADAPNPPTGYANSGLVELLAISGGRFLSLERSDSAGSEPTIKIFLVTLDGADDVSGTPSLSGSAATPVRKSLVVDLESLGIAGGNFEGMTLGQTLGTGERSLILVSDNNFLGSRPTRILAFALEE